MARTSPLLVILLLLLAAPAAGQPLDGLRPVDSVLRLADHFLERGDPYRAIGEYERFRFLAPESPFEGVVRYRIALSYLVGEQYEMAGSLAARLADDEAVEPEVREAAWLLGGRALYRLSLHDAVETQLSTYLETEGTSREGRGWAAYQLAWSRLRAWRFQESLDALALVPPDSAYGERARKLGAELSQGLSVPYRSPLLAGLLSIVPGLGHFYLGQFGTGISALLWNGVFGWALYETIRAGLWGLTALVGVLESLWYAGTIFGAVAGAQRFNRDARLNAIDALAARHPPPGLPPQPDLPGAPPLNLSIRGRF